MRPAVSLAIPQPCSANWAAMTPTAHGRHCAACQKTVVDFTYQSDAEILAHLTQAAGTICGRLRADQLQRPLTPAPVLGITGERWHRWLAAAVAVWSLREGLGLPANAQVPVTQHVRHPRKKPTPPPTPATAIRLVHGMVRDSATHKPLVGVAVFALGEDRHTLTDSAGSFRLRVLSDGYPRHTLRLHFFGYQSRTVHLSARDYNAGALLIELRLGPTEAEIIGTMPPFRQTIISGAISQVTTEPLPAATARWRPSKAFHWLTRPFRRD